MSFEEAVKFTLAAEGGLVEDPHDPGGLTKYGISQRAHPGVDVRNLTEAQAREIYRRDYWDALGCEGMPPSCGIAAFDTAVNLGVTGARKLTPTFRDWRDLLLCRIEHYVSLDRPEYLKGWVKRVLRLRQYIMELQISPRA